MMDTDRKKALIIVDLQNDFCPGGALGVRAGDQIVDVVNTLAREFPLVVASMDWHPADHISFTERHSACNAMTLHAARAICMQKQQRWSLIRRALTRG
jgi:nicotinamidase-related amidase